MKKILITGTAGFIGFHLAKLLLDQGFKIHGYDGMTNYYDIKLKQARNDILLKYPNFSQTTGMLEDNQKLGDTVNKIEPEIIALSVPSSAKFPIRLPVEPIVCVASELFWIFPVTAPLIEIEAELFAVKLPL